MWETGQGGPESKLPGMSWKDKVNAILEKKAAEAKGGFYSGYSDPDLASAHIEQQKAEAALQTDVAALKQHSPTQQTPGTWNDVRSWLSASTYGVPNSAWLLGTVAAAVWLFGRQR